MRHAILAALSAVLHGPAILHSPASERLRDGFARISKAAWLLTHPQTCLALAQVFASSTMRPLFRIEPRLMFKFLRDYLVTGLSRSERAAILIHHYRFLHAHADREFFSRIVDRRLELWQLAVGEHVHRIWLFLPGTPYSEGDLGLIFEADGLDIYTLSFTIGPGTIAGLAVRDAMYIARVQGKGQGLEQIREATKSCHDVSPAALLLVAAEAIAQALELGIMIGIGATAQITTSNGPIQPEDLVKAYDEFWTTAGGSRLPGNMYQLTVPISGKSILLVKRDHRSRAQRKRRFKRAVKEQVYRAFRCGALSAASEVQAT